MSDTASVPAASASSKLTRLNALLNFIRDDDGKVQQTLIWSNVGKGLASWLLWKHAAVILDHVDVLATILAFVILPDMARRIIISKYPVPQ